MKYLVVFILLISITSCKAQSGNYDTKNKKAISNFEEGLKHYQYRNSAKAKEALLNALKAEKNFYEANMLLGDVLVDLKEYKDAARYYNIALSIKPDKHPRYYKILGETLLLDEQYDEAIAPLKRFLTYTNQNPELKKAAFFKLECAEFASHAVKNPKDFKPINLGANINSKFDEYYPALTVDNSQLYYTRMRKADEFSLSTGAFEEDFYISYFENNEWTMSRALGPPLNTHYNEGVQAISPDGRIIIFTACNKDDSFGSCDLYIAEKSGGKWQKPQNLGAAINSQKSDSQPTLSADGKLLIFSSNRAGGQGQFDLWMSRKDENGKWLPAENLGTEINSDQDENSPFLHPGGKVLFFSSKGHPGMGGFDLFKSTMKQDGTWGKPENLGYPINTKSDERHLILNASADKGLISSKYEDSFGGFDIYEFDFPKELRPDPITYIKGKISSNKDDSPVEAYFEVLDLNSGKTIISGNSDKILGDYLSCLPSTGRFAFNAFAEGFLFHSENFTLAENNDPKQFFLLDIKLKPIEKGEIMVLKNIFFETASAELLKESQSELNKLVELMQKNKVLKIEVGGHTDNVGSDESNLKLAQNRAKSVVDYLISKGINEQRLTSKGYGSKMPIGDSSSEEGRAKNRRTEFKVIEI